MGWHVLVEIEEAPPDLGAALEAHPRILSVSVNVRAAPAGWRRALLARTRPSSVLVAVEAPDRREAERIASAAVEGAGARVRSAGAFRR